MNGLAITILVYVGWVCLISAGTLLVYGWDKWQAKRGGWRVSERTLHRMAFLGGWPGAWLAQRWFRHKTVKKTFRRIFWLAPALHVALIVGGWYLWTR